MLRPIYTYLYLQGDRGRLLRSDAKAPESLSALSCALSKFNSRILLNFKNENIRYILTKLVLLQKDAGTLGRHHLVLARGD